MRIDPNNGDVISYDNDFCPNCDGYLDDEYYPYCDRCGEYVGVIARDYTDYNQNPQNTTTNNNSPESNSLLTRGEKTCCGMICLIIFLLWFFGMISR